MKEMWIIVWKDIYGYIHERYFSSFNSASIYYSNLIESSDFHCLYVFSFAKDG